MGTKWYCMIDEKKLKAFYVLLRDHINTMMIGAIFHERSTHGLSFLLELYQNDLFTPFRSEPNSQFTLRF